jgi:hypothetical protein
MLRLIQPRKSLLAPNKGLPRRSSGPRIVAWRAAAHKRRLHPTSKITAGAEGRFRARVERSDRLKALRESRRILKPKGVLLAASICRFASLIDGLSRGFFRDAQFRKTVAADLNCGQHCNPTNEPAYFTTAYFHLPEELAAEVGDAGFDDVQVLSVEGPAWSTALFREAWSDAVERKSLMDFLSLFEREPSVHGASAHLIAAAHRSN